MLCVLVCVFMPPTWWAMATVLHTLVTVLKLKFTFGAPTSSIRTLYNEAQTDYFGSLLLYIHLIFKLSFVQGQYRTQL